MSGPKILFLNFCAFGLLLLSAAAKEHAAVGSLFTYKIEPLLFNWTHQVISEQFRYRPSLQGYPDLPSWMRYMYSHEYHAGFLYGTPPDKQAGQTIRLDIVALNRQNYETRQIIVSIYVAHKIPAPNVIQMKVDNLNSVHLMDPGRVENLRNIFRTDLWPESEHDLSLVFMESAIKMGGRLPLRPQESEGVIVHLGSFATFSTRLKELQEEVRPLYKLPSCTYKRTSVQKIFENAGFKLDWCAFRMVGAEIVPEILFHNQLGSSKEAINLKHTNRRLSILRADVPTRNYIDEFAFAFAIPGVILAILMGILSAVLCFQHPKLNDPQSDYFFENIFHICEQESFDNEDIQHSDNSLQYPPIGSTVQMVQCNDTNKPVTTLKNLKDPNCCLLDNISTHSQSPNTSICQTENAAQARPKPPPYKAGKSGVNI